MKTIILADVDFYPVIQPILEILDAILWPAIAIFVAVGSIYCIFLGAKISKSDEKNSREAIWSENKSNDKNSCSRSLMDARHCSFRKLLREE